MIPTDTPPRPGPLRTAAAILADSWREFRDAKILWLLVTAIGILFAIALTARVTPTPAGRTYLDLAAKALSADVEGIDIAQDSLVDLAGRLDGSLSWIAAAEAEGPDGPETSWRVQLVRNVVPLVGRRESTEAIAARFGAIPDGRLWTVRSIEDVSDSFAALTGQQTFSMEVAPGPDLRLLWPYRFTLFGDTLDMTRPEGAPLGLEVFILQKLLSTGIGGTILLLVSVVITAGMVPTMIRKGTLELLLVRPVPRWQLLVFKYASGLLFVSVLLGSLVLATWIVTGVLSGLWSPGILLALPGLMLFFGLLLALTVLVGVITRSAPAAMLVTVAYWAVLFIVGVTHSQVVASRLREESVGKPRPTSVVDALRGRKQEVVRPLEAGRTPFHDSLAGRITEGIYTVIPHTEDLDTMVDRQLMRDFAVGGRLRRLVESPDFTWLGGVGVTLVHAVGFLAAACAIFTRRDP